ncbi:MAG: hypothetical protein JNK63_08985 [Chthonomonas sp.]|nr:hypothetical protein [Chthonomonas sp.]
MLLPLLAPPPVTVDLIWSTDCPVAQRWVTKVAAWQAAHPAASVIWWFPVDDEPASRAYAKKFRLKGIIQPLKGGDLAFRFALDRFPSTVVRRGNDTVFVGGVGEAAEPDSRFLLAEAYAAAVSSKPMQPARSDPQGCTIPDPMIEKAGSPVTYLKNVRPTIRRYCLPCHAPGGGAPFRLDRHADVRRWSHMILDVLDRQKMPPVRLYDRLRPTAPSPMPNSIEKENIRVWREFGAGGDDPEVTSPKQTKAFVPGTHAKTLNWPKMGRFRFVDLALPQVDQTSGYLINGAPQGSIRMAWTFLATDAPPFMDHGERWKPVPSDWEFVHAAQPQDQLRPTGAYFESHRRRPVVRLLLYGTGDPRKLKFDLIPIPIAKSQLAKSIRFPIEKGRLPSFDGAVEQTSLVVLPEATNALSITVVSDPRPNVLTLLGPTKSWLIGEFTPNSFMPTHRFSNSPLVGQLALNATYGGHSITGERGPSSIAFGDKWNETRLEAFLVVPVPK